MGLLQPDPTPQDLYVPWHVMVLGDCDDLNIEEEEEFLFSDKCEISIWCEGDDMWGSESWGWATPYKIIVSELHTHIGIQMDAKMNLQIANKICNLFNKNKITPEQSTEAFWKFLLNIDMIKP